MILVFWMLSFKPAFSCSSFTFFKRLFSFSLLSAIRLVSSAYLDFLGGSDGKDSACNARDLGSIPGSGQSPGEVNGNPIQYSCLENPMDREAWRATVHRVAKSWTWLNDEHTHLISEGADISPGTINLLCILLCEASPFKEVLGPSMKWTSRAAYLYQPCDMYSDDLAFASTIHI